MPPSRNDGPLMPEVVDDGAPNGEEGNSGGDAVTSPTKLIRIASMVRALLDQAQLVGWLEGLVHGIQATLYTQQLAAQRQFEEMRSGRMLPGAPESPNAGAYL